MGIVPRSFLAKISGSLMSCALAVGLFVGSPNVFCYRNKGLVGNYHAFTPALLEELWLAGCGLTMTLVKVQQLGNLLSLCKNIANGRIKNDLHTFCEIQIGFIAARDPVSLTRQLKLFINVFIDIDQSIDIAVRQLYFDVMKSLFLGKFATNNAQVIATN